MLLLQKRYICDPQKHEKKFSSLFTKEKLKPQKRTLDTSEKPNKIKNKCW